MKVTRSLPKPRNNPPLLELRQVTKVYQTGDQTLAVLRPTNFKIFPGDYLSIRGPSGSGKSTLMHLMGLLDTPSSGKVIFSGQDVSGISEAELAWLRNRSIGFIFQAFNLLPKTAAWEQVALPLVYAGVSLAERRARSETMLGRVGLADRLGHKPNQLSGGQQQRVAIARALVTNPAIIFADEPTGNLDSVSGKTILSIFDELHREGKTLVVVTHEAHVARRAKQHLTISDGRVHENSSEK